MKNPNNTVEITPEFQEFLNRSDTPKVKDENEIEAEFAMLGSNPENFLRRGFPEQKQVHFLDEGSEFLEVPV